MNYEEIKESVVGAGKISAEEFDNKITAKITEMQGLISQEGAAHIVSFELGKKVAMVKTDKLTLIKDLEEGEDFSEIVGVIINSGDINFYTVCPDCGKRIRENNGFVCQDHGKIETPAYRYVLDIKIEDMSKEILKITCFQNQASALLKKSDEEIALLKNNKELRELTVKGLIGRVIGFKGACKKTDFGKEFGAKIVIDDAKRLQENIIKLKNKMPQEEVSFSKADEIQEPEEDEDPSDMLGNVEDIERKLAERKINQNNPSHPY